MIMMTIPNQNLGMVYLKEETVDLNLQIVEV